MAIISHKIFIDSSVFFSFIDRSDSSHAKAVKAMEALAKDGYHLYTSIQTVTECYTGLMKEVGISVALEFLQSMTGSNIEILFPQKIDLINAYRILRSNRERQISLREALNATLMQRRNISQILTFTYWHNLFGTHVSRLGI